MNFTPINTDVDAVLFIVPNHASAYENFIGGVRGEKSTPELFEKVQPSDKMIQVWIFGPDKEGDWDNVSDNWSDYGLPKYLCLPRPDRKPEFKNQEWEHYISTTDFPAYLPASLFEGKKEGDVVTIKVNGKDIDIELNQLNTRYPGSFESMFKKVMKKD